MLPLNKRLKNDNLLNALDLIDELKNVNAEINKEYGTINIYHRTTEENVNKILKSGTMTAKEDGLFFTTNKEGYNSISYGEDYITLNIPIELIKIDDIFNNEAHVKIALNGYKMDISKYLIK